MSTIKSKAIFCAGVSILALTGAAPPASAADVTSGDSNTAAPPDQIEEIVVTAQKREASINSVPMSIQAASGDELLRQGITDTSGLQKLVPGFTAQPSQYGTPIYSIRGVGFQDSSLAAGPTVSVYVDEVPLPFPIETGGTTLDLQRVEVLKGPQGTLFGENSTGGAINFIKNKPSHTFGAGVDASYGRFNTADISGYITGPIFDNLSFRAAAETIQSGDWQQSYTHHATLGSRNYVQGQGSLLWEPVEPLSVLASVSGFRDRSETQAGQFYSFQRRGAGNIPQGYMDYPPAPQDDRAADWSDCVRRTFSLTSDCGGYRKNNTFIMGSLRIDYRLDHDIVVTSLTSQQHFIRDEPRDDDGTTYENLHTNMLGSLLTTFQELRVAGNFFGRGNWIVGGNYQKDDTSDSFLEAFIDGSSNPVFGFLPLGDLTQRSEQQIRTTAVFTNASFPILPDLNLEAGARYTKNNRDFQGCARDAGDGQWAAVAQAVTNFATTGSPIGPVPSLGPGSCGSVDGAPTFAANLSQRTLDQTNVSWRIGANWDITPTTLLYGNVSRGFKAGSFPTLGAATNSQFAPVVQEELQAYEVGVKAGLFDRRLQVNGAVFYYDYTNKQILGDILDPVFGGLNALVNIPKSHVTGFELSGVWHPIGGLAITPSVSYQHSQIDGTFVNYDAFGRKGNFSGESFPYSPEWQGDLDVQYEWRLAGGFSPYVGANANYQAHTNASLGLLPQYELPSYTLLDLRAGVDKDAWRFQVWGRNVTNKYYVNSAYWAADAVVRYTGMPATFGFTVNYSF